LIPQSNNTHFFYRDNDKMKKFWLLLLLVLSCTHNFAAQFSIKSPAFKMNAIIPDEYTCKGVDQSPPLTWRNIPEKTQSLTLIVEDSDALGGTWTHWIVFNIPPEVNELRAGGTIPTGATNAKNSWDGLGYRGPCPSLGAHSYHFKLYALNKVLDLGEGTTRDLVMNAMTGHVIGQTELVGLYQNFKK
jgi:Raf kinase inhibitor-like YbhB/YbcL family protein